MARILFIYAKLNPGIKYTQGMNEVLAVLYYCFQGLETSIYIEPKYVESDLFIAFSNLMTDIRDCFLRELDQEQTGIRGHI
jgi:TBC1 domain family member 13